ncbi:MAG: hypothetical protein WCE48_09675 [Steroidobacteraceae bacterium]
MSRNRYRLAVSGGAATLSLFVLATAGSLGQTGTSAPVLKHAARTVLNTAPARGVADRDASLKERRISSQGDPDAREAGSNKHAVFGGNEFRDALYTPALEAFLKRAYPADDIPGEASVAAWNGWTELNRNKRSDGTWQLIGPSVASVPGVLNFLGDTAPYITAGRVTAMALAPNCGEGFCRLYVGAAGGGVWRTNKALRGSSSQKWEYVSATFGTNAIGSLLLDPNDPTGNTLYAATGEFNASGDSEAGVGIYKTSNGGDTWALVPGSDKFFQRSIGQMAFDKDGNLLVPIGSGVRGVSSVTSGASSSPATGYPLATRGLYRQTGSTFALIRGIVATSTARGSTTVATDPTHPGVIYVNEFSRGIWRSMDNGTTWSQIFSPLNATRSTDRAEFAVTTLKNGKTRMYVGVGNQTDSGANRARVYRTDDALTVTPGFLDLTTDQNIGYCTAQCWYDNFVYTPAGFPDVVYLGGSFSYGQLGGVSNGRAVLLSSDAGATWSDLTQDGDPTHAEFTHPDQHAIVTLPGNPFRYWEGSDGGVVSSDGRFADVSYKCDTRGLNLADTKLCKSLLSRVPHQLANDINRGFSTLQFQSLSVSRQHRNNLIQGGTQDNGTWQNSVDDDDDANFRWNQIIYGDGGQSGFSVTNDALRFNTFTGQASDVNFRNGDPTKWVIATGPIVNSPEGAYFYPPVIADPNPRKARSIFQGSFSVWRTQDWGGNRDYLEANCPEFTTSAADPACGDFVTIGPAGQTDLTDTLNFPAAGVYGDTRRGAAVAWLERAPQNTGTMWAATGAGRVFISDNANDAAASVRWYRLDAGNCPPNRAISAMAVDSGNANHAWISYNGYNVTAGSTCPGHVFEATRVRGTGAATFTDISYNLPDFPVTALVRDDVTGDLYAGSDFGVMKLPAGKTTWVVAGSGLPFVEVSGLTIVSSQRILYAATHGRSAWSLTLP